jgi:uncharacterized SAM-binding protein YcdF (DUF218 family)
MHLIVDLAKTTLLPGSITTIIFAFTSGVVLLYAKPRWGRVWLTFVTVGYWLVSTPIGTSLLARTVSTSHQPLQNAASAQGATAVVMLGGGSNNVISLGRELTSVSRSSALRAIETARVYHLLGDPLVIVSGGVTDPTPGASPESDAYQTAMHSLGVPADRVVSEAESRTTYEEVVVLKRMLDERHIDRFVLVTSPLHMRRSLAVFAAQGLHPVPSPAPLTGDRVRETFPLLPSDAALDVGDRVVYEWLAAAFYWANGWTRAGKAS